MRSGFCVRKNWKMAATSGPCCNADNGCQEWWDFDQGTYGPECCSRCSYRGQDGESSVFVPETPCSSPSVPHIEMRSDLQSPLPPLTLTKPLASKVNLSAILFLTEFCLTVRLTRCLSLPSRRRQMLRALLLPQLLLQAMAKVGRALQRPRAAPGSLSQRSGRSIHPNGRNRSAKKQVAVLPR